jgi:hypothetical protein
MLKESLSIAKFLVDNPLIFKKARGLALHSTGGSFSKCLALLNSLEKKDLVPFDMCVCSFRRNGCRQNFIFQGTEHAVLEMLAGIKVTPVKHMPTPPSVLMKMFASRLWKLHTKIDETNQMYHVVTSRPANPSIRPNPNQTCIQKLSFEDVENRFKRFPGSSWEMRRAVEGLTKFLNRKDLTDDILKKGWDLYWVNRALND